jgi:hypothetical protein
MIMSSDFNNAAITVGHNIHTLRTIILDLAAGFLRDANERRHISNDKHELRNAVSDLTQLLEQIERADTSQVVTKPDPRDPDYTKDGIFRFHNCWRCRDGKLKCAQGNPRQCSMPHARND